MNELLSIKNDLRILQDRDGRRLKEYQLVVSNDELIITDEDGELFEYNPRNPESQRVQEAIFGEKLYLIENCLFGVDSNANSVKICRLRLWIELLKNTYYTHSGELETLPNIDINIKCGNSLISRFQPDLDLRDQRHNKILDIKPYRKAVNSYKNANDKDAKRNLEKLINKIKSSFRSEISHSDPKVIRHNNVVSEIRRLKTQGQLFALSKYEKSEEKKKLAELTKIEKKLGNEISAIRRNVIFQHAFEWRLEFPEVLLDRGEFEGFDLIIGNPPYGVSIKDPERSHLLDEWH